MFGKKDCQMNEFEGFLTSSELTTEIAAIHKRQGEIVPEIKKLQGLLSGDVQCRESIVEKLHELLGEQASLNSKLKEFSLLRTTCIDQRIIKKLKSNHRNIFDQLLKDAMCEYLHSGKRAGRGDRVGVL